uniref:Uncharacterized protein n=1 Tax=Ditylenchus dipsaci TaxID=166011 RepID=A0A915DXM3_9BILA
MANASLPFLLVAPWVNAEMTVTRAWRCIVVRPQNYSIPPPVKPDEVSSLIEREQFQVPASVSSLFERDIFQVPASASKLIEREESKCRLQSSV